MCVLSNDAKKILRQGSPRKPINDIAVNFATEHCKHSDELPKQRLFDSYAGRNKNRRIVRSSKKNSKK